MKSNITKLNFILIALFAAFAVQSCTEDRGNSYTSKTKVNPEGLEFIRGAHETGLLELEASKLAKEKATNADVKTFADLMVTDHTTMGANVDTLAAQKFVTVLDHVNEEHKAELDSLAKKSGAEFDKAYMEMMVDEHKETSELFNENESSNYRAVRKVAFTWSSRLEQYLAKAEEVKKSLK